MRFFIRIHRKYNFRMKKKKKIQDAYCNNTNKIN